jgi:hypothetical protein
MRARSCKRRTDVAPAASVDGERLAHFRLGEFENSEGLAMVRASALGGIWTLSRSNEWLRGARSQRYSKARQALEAGIELA